MTKEMGASAEADRATGLRPQPAAQSSLSSVPSAWQLIADGQIVVPDCTPVFVRGRYGDVYGPLPVEMFHPDVWGGNMLHASHDAVAIALCATPTSFCWTDDETLAGRALSLVRSMASVRCKNSYPIGVIGHEARMHYDEARRIASGIAARSDETPAAAQPEGQERDPQSDAQTPGKPS